MKNLKDYKGNVLQYKYLPAFLIGIFISIFGHSQTFDTARIIQPVNGSGFQYKILKSDSASLFPKDTLHLKYDWRGMAFKGDKPYFWNGTSWKTFGAVSNTRNGIRLTGDTTMLGDSVDRYTYIQILASLAEGSLYHQLRLGNRPKAQSLNGNIPDQIYKNTYGPAIFYVEQLFSTQNGDLDSSFYNAAATFYTRVLRDSTDTEYKIGGRTEYLGNGGIYALNQYFPPRDSNIVRVGRDGQSGNSGFFQLDWGNYFGYKSKIVNPADLPDFPVTNVRSSIDLVRNIDNTRTKTMYGVGVTGFNAMYKTYQTTINMATYAAGNYWSRIIDYDAYGDANPLISVATKAKTLSVATVDTAIGFYARPHYLYTNTVKNGFGFVAAGDSDYNRFNWVRIGYNGLPTRQNGGQDFIHQLEVTGDVMASDSIGGFLTGGQGLYARIDRAIGNEAGVNFSMKDSAVTATIGTFMPDNRDSRYLYIRVEAFSSANYADNSLGEYIRFETGGNHNNVSRISRNGNWTFGNGATALNYRWYKKGTFDGSVAILDTLTIKNIKFAPAGDTVNYKTLVINSNGDVFQGNYGSGSGGGGGVSSVAAGWGTNFTTITATGSVILDSAVGSSNAVIGWPRYNKLKDSINAIFTPMARTLTAGYGLTGGGDLSANRTLVFDSATVFTQARAKFWDRAGNTGVSGSQAGDWLGTNNSVPIRFRTANTERMRLDSARAQLAIGGSAVNATDALIIQAVGAGNYDGLRIWTSNLAGSATYSAAGIQHAGAYDINTTSGSISLTPTTGVIVGTSFGSPTALFQLGAGSTSRAPMRWTSGSLATGGNIQAGNMEFLTDKWYGTITTGTAVKEFTMNDAALTSGTTPVATGNGRLTDGVILASGGYAPTLTTVANCSSLSNDGNAYYRRQGNIMHVSGRIDGTVTATSTLTTIGVSLQVPSAFTATGDLHGTVTANAGAAVVAGHVRADATNDRAQIDFYSFSAGTSYNIYYEFTYIIQ